MWQYCLASACTLVFLASATAQQGEVDPATLSDPYAKKLITDAYQKSLEIKTADDLSAVIENCERALAERLVEKDQAYAHHLAGWAYNRRGEFYAEQAAGQAQVGLERQANAFDSLALDEFQSAIKHDPQSWKAYHNRGVSYALHNKLDEALEDFNKVLSLDATYLNAWFNRAEVLAEQGRFEEAADDYSHALKLNGNDLLSIQGRAKAWAEVGKWDAALADYEQIIQFEPNNAAARCSRGDMLQHLGNWDAAAREYQQVIKLFPKQAAAYRGAAWLMATCPEDGFRNAELAVRTAEKGLELSGKDDYEALNVLAAAHANQARFDLAVNSMKQALALSPDKMTMIYKEYLQLYLDGKPLRQ